MADHRAIAAQNRELTLYNHQLRIAGQRIAELLHSNATTDEEYDAITEWDRLHGR